MDRSPTHFFQLILAIIFSFLTWFSLTLYSNNVGQYSLHELCSYCYDYYSTIIDWSNLAQPRGQLIQQLADPQPYHSYIICSTILSLSIRSAFHTYSMGSLHILMFWRLAILFVFYLCLIQKCSIIELFFLRFRKYCGFFLTYRLIIFTKCPHLIELQ